MKILAVSDIHGDTGLVKKIKKIADKEKIETILIAGDLTWFDNSSKDIIGPLIKKDRDIIIIHGNHDSKETIEKIIEKYPKTINLHKTGIEKNDVGFFGSGTTDWGFKKDSETVFKELEIGHKKIKNSTKKILVSHCPPTGSIIEFMGFPGSYGVKKALDKFNPDFLICGHIHEGGGIIEQIGNTKVINVSMTPTIFEI